MRPLSLDPFSSSAWRARASALLLATLAACAEDASCLTLQVCDIAEPGCRREVFAATACERGQPNASMPKVRAISLKQYAAELAEASDEEQDFQTRAYWRALSLFQLTPPIDAVSEAATDNQVTNVLAYYSSESKDVTIIQRSNTRRVEAMLTLSHEFTHALQDQRDDLKTFMETHADTFDAALSLRCLVEGEAQAASELTMADLTYGDARRVDWERYFSTWLTNTLDELSMAKAPLLATRWLVYPLGTRVALPKYRSHGHKALAGYYEEPPLTFRSWTNQTLVRMPPEPMDCQPPEPPAGYTQSMLDRQGMGGLLALYVGTNLGARYDDSHAWVSDWFAIYTAEDESSEEVAVAWRLRLGSADAARDLHAHLTRVEAPFGIELQGQEVMLTAASDSELYAGWEQGGCGPDKGRARTLPHYQLPASVRERLRKLAATHGRSAR